jgi:hypothetical protein
MKDVCLSTGYLFRNKMNVHLNMLGALMLHRITREIDGTDIVTIHQSGLRDMKVELREKVVYPASFRDNFGNTPIFDFSTGMRK